MIYRKEGDFEELTSFGDQIIKRSKKKNKKQGSWLIQAFYYQLAVCIYIYLHFKINQYFIKENYL